MSKNKGKTPEELLQETLVPEEEQPYKVPKNWVWVRTGTLNNIVTGSTPSKKNEGYYGGNIPFFKPADLKGKIVEVSEYVNEDGLKVSREVPANSTLVCCIGSIGKVGYTQLPGITNQQINALIPNQKILDPLFTYYYSQSNYFNRELWNRSSSTTISIINKSRMSEIPFPLAPKEEQKRIADKVERLLNKINQAKQLIEDAKETFEHRRASILDKAFRGELTRNWRDENTVVETGRELLTKIKADINILKNMDNDAVVRKERYSLPSSWEWETLENLCYTVTDGDHQAPPKVEEGIPFLVISNINTGKLDLNASRFVPRDYYQNLKESRRPRKGDILYSVTGSIGIPVLVNTEEEFCFQRHIAILKPSKFINPEYLFYLMKSRLVYNQAISIATGTAQLTVPLAGLRKILVPIPSIEEQNSIVKVIDRIFKSTESSNVLQSEVLTLNIESMQQSILSKAFRGELGTNESADESATSLLINFLQKKIQVKPKD